MKGYFNKYIWDLRKRNSINREKIIKDYEGNIVDRIKLPPQILPIEDISNGTGIAEWYLEAIYKGEKFGHYSNRPYSDISLEFIIRLSNYFNVSIQSFVDVIRKDMGQEVLGSAAKFGTN